MSDNEENRDTSWSVDLQNYDNDHDHVSVSTTQADAKSNVWYILYTTISIYFY
jgi:hypothetical protein